MKICLITPGQPSTDPRLVKEADALTEAGYQVHVICAHWIPWADDMDKVLLASRSWSCSYVGGHRRQRPLGYLWTRLRHGASRRIMPAWRGNSLLRRWAISRVLPELERAAKSIPSDLYIAHNLGALPAAVAAARRHHAYVGFDAEDFHSGTRPFGTPPSPMDTITEYIERRYLPECDYITAASPGIAEAYAAKHGIRKPVTILNVFPLSQRPREFRPSNGSNPLTLYWFSQTIGADRGLEDAVQAIGAMGECKIELHLAGSWQPKYKERLLQIADSVGVEPGQIIAHGTAPPDEMARLAAQYDVGLALEQAQSENRDICLTNKIFTYLLAGNAVIATSTRGQRPIMDAIGTAGFCYDPGDVHAFAQCLKLWYEDRDSLDEARRQAWNWGTHRYNWDMEKTAFLQIIGEVLGSPARQPA